MKYSIEIELTYYLLELINDGTLTDDNVDHWHFYAFNEDYYIIHHYKALQWLKKHNIDAFRAIDTVKEYQLDNFGEFTTEIEPESIVNMLVYIYGEEMVENSGAENINELKEYLNNL
tara:strand:+ start:237 stop:587 length:351 start_codon:yes stop_codon:yes gene_type:complete